MSNYWAKDSRIDPDSAMRDLEKKVHFLMQQLCGAGVIATRGNNVADIPSDIDDDGNEVLGQLPNNS